MTKQDFEAVAETLKEWKRINAPFEVLVGALADYFQIANPNFDFYKFVRACGIEPD